MEDRLFGLDVQLLFDAFVLFVVIMIMYAIMSRLFFKPVRAFLEQRNHCIFTGGVVEGNSICSAAFYESAALRAKIGRASCRERVCKQV